jgi:maltooligosyltrehalose trehalohydrolase
MTPLQRGYHKLEAEDIEPGTLYLYRLDSGLERPDPASRFQPQGVHGPSEVIDPKAYRWENPQWSGRPWSEYVLYELHVGTFSAGGTFDGVRERLDYLKELGVNAVELMPVAQFPGARNWGYDGAYLFAVQNSYGRPEELKRLVDACHGRGMAAVLDVVYNHLGPEGNYLGDFGPYFTDRYQTPWGSALNFDGPHSDEVRAFFVHNALYWLSEFGFDALRLDAIHSIRDVSARPFLFELSEAVHAMAASGNRGLFLIAETTQNEARTVLAPEIGGYGMDAQWNDDFHHALHSYLTGERNGYYQDFGALDDLALALRQGYVLTGQYAGYRGRRHGRSPQAIPSDRFVVYAQNHDQIGNRGIPARLSVLLNFAELKLTAGLVLLSANIPMLFMGEEYGETAPFHYFISHLDPALLEAVREGRLREFASFKWDGIPAIPGEATTFQSSKLNWHLAVEGKHKQLYDFHRELIRLRRELPALSLLSKEHLEVEAFEQDKLLVLRRWSNSHEVLALFHFGEGKRVLDMTAFGVPPGPPGWSKVLDSEASQWGGESSAAAEYFDAPNGLELALHPRQLLIFLRTAR